MRAMQVLCRSKAWRLVADSTEATCSAGACKRALEWSLCSVISTLLARASPVADVRRIHALMHTSLIYTCFSHAYIHIARMRKNLLLSYIHTSLLAYFRWTPREGCAIYNMHKCSTCVMLCLCYVTWCITACDLYCFKYAHSLLAFFMHCIRHYILCVVRIT